MDHMIFYHGNHMHWHVSATSLICGLIIWHVSATSPICPLIVWHVSTTSTTNTLIIQHVNNTSLPCQMLWCHNLRSTRKCDKIYAPTHLCIRNFAHVHPQPPYSQWPFSKWTSRFYIMIFVTQSPNIVLMNLNTIKRTQRGIRC